MTIDEISELRYGAATADKAGAVGTRWVAVTSNSFTYFHHIYIASSLSDNGGT